MILLKLLHCILREFAIVTVNRTCIIAKTDQTFLNDPHMIAESRISAIKSDGKIAASVNTIKYRSEWFIASL